MIFHKVNLFYFCLKTTEKATNSHPNGPSLPLVSWAWTSASQGILRKTTFSIKEGSSGSHHLGPCDLHLPWGCHFETAKVIPSLFPLN